MKKDYPILEFDGDREAIIDPQALLEPLPEMPRHCVICFFQDVIDHFAKEGLLTEIGACGSEMGKHPIYRMELDEGPVALFHPGVGAPLAAGLLEEIIAYGASKIIVCGGAGVLDKKIAAGHLVVPTAAVRDEGTSYHYLPPAREATPHADALEAIQVVLKRRKVEYVLAKTWTTDGYYRETKAKVALRKSEGCLTVEMEAAALFAVAQFRKVQLAQILYGGDNLDGESWDSRDWQRKWSVREKLIYLAAEACLLL